MLVAGSMQRRRSLKLGRLCRDPVLRRLGYRRYPIDNYIVIFRIVEKAKEVRVVHFFHMTQDYLSALKNEL